MFLYAFEKESYACEKEILYMIVCIRIRSLWVDHANPRSGKLYIVNK